MKIGIVGFAGSGKTTLFNALTGQDAPVGFGGAGKVNLGQIQVPDARLDRLTELNNPKRTVYAEITFADVPGGRGAQSLDPQTLGRIREMDALVQVLRGFDGGQGDPEPVRELNDFQAELILADQAVAEKRVERLRKDRSNPTHLELMERCLNALEESQPLRELEFSDDERQDLSAYAFLSLKPMLVVLSQEEGDAGKSVPSELAEAASACHLEVLPLCGAMEAEIAGLEPEDQKAFLEDMGLSEPASTRFIQAAFRLLDLITFFTQGTDECRAWPIHRGCNAVLASRAIHSDIARGFIRAEVIAYADMDKYGSEAACKQNGCFRVEGRDYIVKDGDICHYRFNI